MALKNKIIIAIICLSLFVSSVFVAHAALLEWGFSALAGTHASVGAGGASTVPAKLWGRTATGYATKWFPLLIPGAGVARIGATLFGLGLGIGANYLFDYAQDWFNSKRIDREGNITETRNIPPTDNYQGYFKTATAGGFPAFPQTDMQMAGGTLALRYAFIGIFDSWQAAESAINAWWQDNFCKIAPDNYFTWCTNVTSNAINDQVASGGWAMNNAPAGFPSSGDGIVGGIDFDKFSYVASRKGWGLKSGGGIEYCVVAFYPRSGVGKSDQDLTRKLTPEELEKKMRDEWNEKLNRDILKAMQDALAGSGFSKANPAGADAVNGVLRDAVTPGQLEDLEDEADTNPMPPEELGDESKVDLINAIIRALASQGLSANQIARAIADVIGPGADALTPAQIQTAVQQALATQGLSGAQVQSAVATAVKGAIDDTSGVELPIDPTIAVPDKLSLTGVLNDFYGSISSLPMFQTLQGLTVNVNGSSTLCLALGSNLGGTYCLNAGDYQDELNSIGSVFLGLTTILSFIGIFKS